MKALIAHGAAVGQEMPVLKAVIRTNEEQPRRVVDLLKKHWPDLRQRRVAVLGLAFKPGTSDVRESPAFPILRELEREGAILTAHDPVAIPEAKAALPDSKATYCATLEEALENVDAVIVVTPWEQFRSVPTLLRGRQTAPVFIDCRRAFDKNSVNRYEGIGL